MARKRDPSALKIEEIEVTVQGTAPLVILPLGAFKGRQVLEDADEVEHALKLYRRESGELGFPAGGIKRAVMEAIAKLDLDTRRSVESGMHVIGEEATNMVVLEGKHHGEDFDFDFKKPERTVTLKLPVLDKWECKFRVQYMGQTINRKLIEKFLGQAGEEVGLGHRRPDQGTFKVQKIVSVKQ